MKSLNLQEVLALPEVDIQLNPWKFEEYCGACFNFDTDECPYRYEVDNFTEWKKIRCDNFDS